MTSTTSVIGNFTDRPFVAPTDYNKAGQKYAYVSLTADGNIVAAVSGKKIRVLSLLLFSSEADELITVQIRSDDASGDTLSPKFLTGSLQNTFSGMASERGSIQQPIVLPFSPAGWMETVAGEALFADVTVGSSIGTEVGIMVTYDETS